MPMEIARCGRILGPLRTDLRAQKNLWLQIGKMVWILLMKFVDGLHCCRVRMCRHEEMNLPWLKQNHQPEFAMIGVWGGTHRDAISTGSVTSFRLWSVWVSACSALGSKVSLIIAFWSFVYHGWRRLSSCIKADRGVNPILAASSWAFSDFIHHFLWGWRWCSVQKDYHFCIWRFWSIRRECMVCPCSE